MFRDGELKVKMTLQVNGKENGQEVMISTRITCLLSGEHGEDLLEWKTIFLSSREIRD